MTEFCIFSIFGIDCCFDFVITDVEDLHPINKGYSMVEVHFKTCWNYILATNQLIFNNFYWIQVIQSDSIFFIFSLT